MREGEASESPVEEGAEFEPAVDEAVEATFVEAGPWPICSEAPLSAPHSVLYQAETCWRSDGEVQAESQMPVAEVRRVVRYADWQKQIQAVWSAEEVPLHA